MELNYNKLVKLTLALSGLKNEDVAAKIGVNPASLSRNESKNLFYKVHHFFDKYDSEVSEAIDVLLDHFEWGMYEDVEQHVCNETQSEYKHNNKDAEIRWLKSEIRTLNNTIKLLERQYRDKLTEINDLEKIIRDLEQQIK